MAIRFSSGDMAEEKVGLEALLSHAKEQERLYDWSRAADDYDRALRLIPDQESTRVGDILERKSYALYKAALQSENVNAFRIGTDRASECYSKAKEAYLKAEGPELKGRMSRCDAMLAFMRFLRSTDADHRRNAALESWNHSKDSMDVFAALDEMDEFCRTFYDLSLSAIYYSNLVPDYGTRKRTWMEATSRGERAAAFARHHEDQDTCVKILTLVSCFLNKASYATLCEESPQHCHDRSIDLWREAESVSKEKVLLNLPIAYITGDSPIDPQREMANELLAFKKALELVGSSKDRLVIGHALSGVSFCANWASSEEADKEREDALEAESLATALEARSEFQKIGFFAEIGHNIWVMSPETEYCLFMTISEKDPKKIRELAERGLRALPEYTEFARSSGYTWQIASAELNAGLLQQLLARTENDIEKKRTMLHEAVDHMKKAVNLVEQWDPGTVLNLGTWHLNLADVQADLAEVSPDHESGAITLREAIRAQKRSIEEFEEGAKLMYMTQDRGSVAVVGWLYDRLGERYCGLFELENQPDSLREAMQCFERASEACLRSEKPSRAAESLWQAARVCDQLGDPVKAAEKFSLASKEFKAGAEKIPRLKNLFLEQAKYLEAWAEFETAKYHHSHQEYQQAESHFEKAAELHESLEKWRFLASNYRAWALIDRAEALSREEHRKEASDVFTEAASLFEKSGSELDDAGRKAENADEKRMIARLLSASKPRREYCLARATIERARQMDVDGMSSSSSDLYKTAADELERIASVASSEQDRREMRLIAVLSRAWQKMNQADAEVAAEPYGEAARLFEEAKELSGNDKMKALALGHSRFCMALEAGTKFADSRDPSLHATATKHLESASGFYLKAGSESSSEYARASKLLFDAYARLDEASQEKDHQKAARVYVMVEKVLHASSESYAKAGQPGKRDQVLKLLGKVKKERELALSLTEVFEAPIGVSSTAAFGAPAPTQEEAVGLERFAHADIQATLIVKPKELLVDQDLSLEIELVNAGRGVAQLTKVDKVIPEGFEIAAEPEKYRIEDSYLNMKGRRLDALKTEDVKLLLKSKSKGQFTVKPRIMYLDESGKYKSFELEPVIVTVKELGISGWLKGSEKKK